MRDLTATGAARIRRESEAPAPAAGRPFSVCSCRVSLLRAQKTGAIAPPYHEDGPHRRRHMSAHRLGFAVKVLGDGGLPSHDTRRWASSPHLRCSLERLSRILDYLARCDIRMYRLATALAPYASHPELPQFHRQVEECADELAAIGKVVRRSDIRLSSHPGQYTVLNSRTVGSRLPQSRSLKSRRLFSRRWVWGLKLSWSFTWAEPQVARAQPAIVSWLASSSYPRALGADW